MSAFNIVRFRVKPGREEEFVRVNREIDRDYPGLRRAALVETGDRGYCFIGEWDGMDDIAAAREGMVKNLDRVRDLLEELEGGLGVTDPVSGEAVIDFK